MLFTYCVLLSIYQFTKQKNLSHVAVATISKSLRHMVKKQNT